MMKNIITVVLLFVAGLMYSQTAPKYAIIASKFGFQKTADQYGLNTLTKLFFVKMGSEVYFDNESLPADASDQPCNKIFVDVIENNSLLVSRVKVVIKDCRNNIIVTSEQGSSKEKDYKLAYTEALREALKSIDVAKINLTAKASPQPFAVVQQPKTVTPVESQVLNAQPIPNGFQLVDNTPKVVLRIFKTTETDVYVASDDTTNGVVFKDGPLYSYEYYLDGKLVKKQLNIKF